MRARKVLMPISIIVLVVVGAVGVSYFSTGQLNPFAKVGANLCPPFCFVVSYTPTVVATLSGVLQPTGVAFDSGLKEVIVSSGTSLIVISDSTNSAVAKANVYLPPPIGATTHSKPYGLAYDSSKGEIFTAQLGGTPAAVSVVSDSTNSVTHNIYSSNPYYAAYDSAKGEVFVTNYFGGVIVISDTTNQVTATVPIAGRPTGIAYDAAKSEIFVTDGGSEVYVISDATNSVVATIKVGNYPWGVACDPSKGEVFVSNWASGTVSVISDASNTVVATVNVGSGPKDLAYDPRGYVFVANSGSSAVPGSTVSVISDSSNQVQWSVNVGSGPWGVVFDSYKNEVFVTNYSDGSISVISG